MSPRLFPASTEVRSATVNLHGHDIAYRVAGDGPEVVVLVHGIAGSSSTWHDVLPLLAERYHVIAPDLHGHGESAKPRTDYSLASYANLLRDLLFVLGHRRATFVGHSLGGGVAMQAAYQYPERCERLVLVGSGGLGKEVSPILRALTLPGSEYVLAALLATPAHNVVRALGHQLGRVGIKTDRLVEELFGSWERLTDPRSQRAFIHTIRAVIDFSGQRVSARDRLYLASEVPTMIVWGDNDSIIPVEHGAIGNTLMPGSRLEIFSGSGHFIPLEEPERFARLVDDFIQTTEPAAIEPDSWRHRLVPEADDLPA